MRRWLMGIIFSKSLNDETSTANQFVENARRKVKEEANGDEIALAFAGGLEFMIENLMKHLQADRGKVLSARDFDNDTLDRVYRYALGGAEKANPLLKEPSQTAQYEGLKLSFGCLALSHLYRLRFLETQVSGVKLQAVETATRNVQDLIRDLLTFSISQPSTNRG